MTRRLLGYVVKLPNGEWYNGKSRADKDFDGYPWTRDAKKRHVFTEYQDACRYVLTYVPENLLRIVPVFSKPKPAELKPAPVVAAEVPPTRFALPSDFVPKMRARIRNHDGACGCVECVAYYLGFADCEDEIGSKTRRRKSTVEAIAAAREEGRREAFAVARGVVESEVVHVRTREHMVKKLDEAAKGAAK